MNNVALWGPAFKDFDRFFVGMNDRLDRMVETGTSVAKSAVQNYPPYNILKTDTNKFLIEIAVAGFSESEITIDALDGRLEVKGSHTDEKVREHLFRGIAARSFQRTFVLDEHIRVEDAVLENGMLEISLVRIVPDHMLPKRIEIESGGPQLLNE